MIFRPTDELLRIAKSGNVEKLPQKPAPLRAEGGPPAPQGALAPAVAPAAGPGKTPPAVHGAPKAFADFAGLVQLVAEKRDVKLKGELERFVRPIRVDDGRIEFALEPQAPPTLANELMRKLEAWTGRRHIVTVAREGGAEPLLKQKKSRQAQALAEAMEDPAVKAVFRFFPKAEILAVREPELAALPAADDTSTPEDQE
ncbi:MAG: hypothetical protein U1E15_05945 [Hyphomicrobiales bacterium]